MAAVEITATKVIEGVEKSATILFDFGADVNEAIGKFGAEVVFSNFKRSAVITAQAAMRRLMEANKTQDEIAESMKAWAPGVSLERSMDPVKAIQNKFATMSPEDQQALIDQLMQKMGK